MAVNRTRARIDRTICCGTSNCGEAAPDAYEIDDEARPHVRAGASDEDLLTGAQACPMSAIEIIDIETGRRIYP